MKDLKCSVHKTELVEKEVPIFYGMPTADSNIFDIESRFPHHGLWSLGGCVISPDDPDISKEPLCLDCHEAAKKLYDGDSSA